MADIHLKLTRTDQKCGARSFFMGNCGAFVVRLSLSMDAKNELLRRGTAILPDQDVCLNPLSGCAMRNMSSLTDVLKLLS